MLVTDFNLIWLFVMIGALIFLFAYSKRPHREDRFDRAQKQFFEMAIHSKNSKFSFDPKTATIIRKDIDQTNGESTTYAITLYARNEQGEYFVYRSDGDTPAIKHLEHRIAKIVLKKDYIAPKCTPHS